MDDGLKQRIIGAIVLLALAVIFIPLIFDREKISPVDKRSFIPPVPHIDLKAVDTAKASRISVPVKSEQVIFLPNELTPIDDTPDVSGLAESGIPNAWVLQVASFLHQQHADELRDDLIAAGYTVYTRNVSLPKGPVVRVYIGPKLDKNRLLEDKRKIEQKYKMQSLILKFEP